MMCMLHPAIYIGWIVWLLWVSSRRY